jgi:hypothetical protein
VGRNAKRRSPRARAVAIGVVLALALAAPAQAQEPPSAADQYAELVPDAGGPKAPAPEQDTRGPLPPEAKAALDEAQPEIGEPLEEVATSSQYGAPSSPRPPVPREPERPEVSEGASVPAALQSTVEAVTSTDDRQLVGTGVALLLVTLGAVLLAVRRVRTID